MSQATPFSGELLSGKRILITGGGTGLGRGVARHLVDHGAQVHLWGRREAVLADAAAEASASRPGSVHFHTVDVRDYANVDETMGRIWADHGPLTGVINNAAANFIAQTKDLSPRAFEAVTSTVMNGSFHTTHAAGKRWIAEGLGKPILDNYWQTETGWPILSLARGVAPADSRFGSPGVPMYGYRVKLIDESSGEELTQPHQKGLLVIDGPLPPGCMQTVWRDDERFVRTYWTGRAPALRYSTFDWALRDEEGYYFILGRSDDVINVAGHRLGTREIEECISGHAAVAEVAVVGVADALKGQVALAFAVLRDPARAATPELALALEGEILKKVDAELGAVARPSRVRLVTALPKTRSGKLLRRALQAVAEGRDPGDLSTIEDPSALEQIKATLG